MVIPLLADLVSLLTVVVKSSVTRLFRRLSHAIQGEGLCHGYVASDLLLFMLSPSLRAPSTPEGLDQSAAASGAGASLTFTITHIG